MLVARYQKQVDEATVVVSTDEPHPRTSLIATDSEVSFASDCNDTDSDRFGFEKRSEDSIIMGTFVKRLSDTYT